MSTADKNRLTVSKYVDPVFVPLNKKSFAQSRQDAKDVRCFFLCGLCGFARDRNTTNHLTPSRNHFTCRIFISPPNTYGKYYAAMFLSIRKFLASEMAYNLRAISNLNDSSFIVSSGVTYELANNALLTLELEGYLGAKDREYTLSGNALSATISMELEF